MVHWNHSRRKNFCSYNIMHTLHNKKTIDFPIPMDIHARNITYWLLPEYGTLVPSLLKFQPGLTSVPKVLFGHINSLWLFWACLINFILEGTMTINSRDFYHHRGNKPGVWFRQTHLCKQWLKKLLQEMFHPHDDTSGYIYCIAYSWFCPIMPLPFLPKEGIYIHWS